MMSGKVNKTTVLDGNCPRALYARMILPPASDKRNLSQLTFLLSILGLALFFLISPPTHAIEWPGVEFELCSAFTYIRLAEDHPLIKDHINSEAVLEMEVSGALPKEDWHYALGIITTADASTSFFSGCALQELLLDTYVNTGEADHLCEVGKQDWEWGKCFSRTPTYPLPEGYFWGAQWTKTKEQHHVIFGAATSTHRLLERKTATMGFPSEVGALTAWLRSGGFLTVSDYEFVLSYQSQAKDALTPAYYNLGFDTSRDFLNGLAMHGSLNLRYTPESKEKSSDTRVDSVVGGEYTWGTKTIVCEVLNQSDCPGASLVWAINNYSAFFSSWQWGLESLWDLHDGGRYFRLLLEYSVLHRLTPALELLLFTGAKESKINASPVDLLVTLRMRAIL